MDGFALCLDGLCLTGQAVLHILFAGRLTGKRPAVRHFAAYLALLCGIQLASAALGLHEIVSIAAGVLALYGVSRLALGNRREVSWLAAVLAFYISQLSFGLINSVEAVLFPGFIGSPLLYLLLAAAQAVFFALCACCYRTVRKLLAWTEDSQTPYLALLLFPGLFFFAAELYILHTSYRAYALSVSPGDAGKHGALLFLQAMGLAALLCTLYAYRQLCRGFQAREELRSLAQASQAQRTYIAEARARYEQTRAFRHDIRNHLSVLKGLWDSGRLEEGRAYLNKLDAVSGALSVPCRTGNPVVDVLLGEKLELAKASGIAAEASLVLPSPCVIDDFDLCVLFANALDNAVDACRSGGEPRSIRVFGRRQGDFYMLVFENTCSEGPLPPPGTGLSNIKAAAEKYHGAALAEKEGRRFTLSVLLNISLHPESRSAQKP